MQRRSSRKVAVDPRRRRRKRSRVIGIILRDRLKMILRLKRSRGGGTEVQESPSQMGSSTYSALPLLNPPVGFVFVEQGKVLMASNKRITTIVDSTNNLPLDCVIRRVFRNSRGDECMLLSVDMNVTLQDHHESMILSGRTKS